MPVLLRRRSTRKRASGPTVLATETWTGANGAAWPAGWATRTTANNTIQGNRGRQTCTGNYASDAVAIYDSMPAAADSDTYIEVTLDSTVNEQYLQVGARVDATQSASNNPQNGYSIEVAEASGQVALNRFNATAKTQVGSTQTVTLPTSGTVGVRLNLVGSRIRWRLWNTSGAEPSTWNLDVVDSSPYLTAGKTFLSTQSGGNATARSFDWDNLLVTSAT